SRLSAGSKKRGGCCLSPLTPWNEVMKDHQTSYDYGACQICGERMEEQRIKQDFWIKGKLIVIEDVPAGVCPQCGEKVVKAEVGRQIATLTGNVRHWRKTRTMNVPVIRFAKEVA